MFVHRRRASANSAQLDPFETTQLQLLNESLQFLLEGLPASIERHGRTRPEAGGGTRATRRLPR